MKLVIQLSIRKINLFNEIKCKLRRARIYIDHAVNKGEGDVHRTDEITLRTINMEYHEALKKTTI